MLCWFHFIIIPHCRFHLGNSEAHAETGAFFCQENIQSWIYVQCKCNADTGITFPTYLPHHPCQPSKLVWFLAKHVWFAGLPKSFLFLHKRLIRRAQSSFHLFLLAVLLIISISGTKTIHSFLGIYCTYSIIEILTSIFLWHLKIIKHVSLEE